MTASEMKQVYHRARQFAGVAKLFESESRDDATRRYETWRRALRDVPCTEVLAILDDMLAGDEEIPKYDWSMLPRFIRLAHRRRKSYTWREDHRVQCDRCGGHGYIDIMHPGFVRQFPTAAAAAETYGDQWRSRIHREWRKMGEGPLMYGVVCDCAAGDRRWELVERWRNGDRAGRPPALQRRFNGDTTVAEFFETGIINHNVS